MDSKKRLYVNQAYLQPPFRNSAMRHVISRQQHQPCIRPFAYGPWHLPQVSLCKFPGPDKRFVLPAPSPTSPFSFKRPNLSKINIKKMHVSWSFYDTNFFFKRTIPTPKLYRKTKCYTKLNPGHKPVETSCSPVDRV